MGRMTDQIREEVRVAMARRALNNRKLAQEAKVSEQHLSKMLRGEASELPDAWRKVLDHLGLGGFGFRCFGLGSLARRRQWLGRRRVLLDGGLEGLALLGDGAGRIDGKLAGHVGDRATEVRDNRFTRCQLRGRLCERRRRRQSQNQPARQQLQLFRSTFVSTALRT